jgi:hypothetical protein
MFMHLDKICWSRKPELSLYMTLCGGVCQTKRALRAARCEDTSSLQIEAVLTKGLFVSTA